MLGKLLLLFILVPLVELAIFMALSDVISLPLTLGIIVITGALGAYLAKQQGGLALRNFQNALAGGKLPHEEATDGILVLIAGAVLLTPGFLTDACGFALLVPAVRGLLRGRLGEWLKKRVSVSSNFPTATSEGGNPEMKQVQGRVVDVEVVE